MQITNTGPSGLDSKLKQNPLRLTNPGGTWLGLCEHVRQVVLRFRPNHMADLRRDGLTSEMECNAAALLLQNTLRLGAVVDH